MLSRLFVVVTVAESCVVPTLTLSTTPTSDRSRADATLRRRPVGHSARTETRILDANIQSIARFGVEVPYEHIAELSFVILERTSQLTEEFAAFHAVTVTASASWAPSS
jgi:hypothetical protein